MSARKFRRSSTRACNNQDVNRDGGGNADSSSQGSPGAEANTLGLIGRLVAKYQGETLLRGVVDEYNEPSAGKGETWTVRYDDKAEHVDRSELDQQLHLQTAKQKSTPGSEKRGRGRPRKSSNSSAKRRAVTSPKYGGVKGQQSATSSTLVARSTPKKGKSKGKGPSGSNGSLELQGGPYLGKRIAQDFPRFGVFTGEVVEAKAKGTKDTLFNVMFEDGDEGDYTTGEITRHIKLYGDLVDSFAASPAEDEATDSENDDDTTMPTSDLKGKGKAKAKRTSPKHVGQRIRVFFPSHDDYYNGTVTKHLAPEDDDSYGDLYHVTYDDGDSEDLDSEQLEEAIAIYRYNKRYPLVRKKVSIPTSTKKNKKVYLFGDKRAGSPVFSTVQGYHDDGRYKEV